MLPRRALSGRSVIPAILVVCAVVVSSCDDNDPPSPDGGSGSGGSGGSGGQSDAGSDSSLDSGSGDGDAGTGGVAGDGAAPDGDAALPPTDGAPDAPADADSAAPSLCGNGQPNAGEACDDGPLNGKGPNRCIRDCSARCGDGKVEGTETCDEGALNGQVGHCNVGCGYVCVAPPYSYDLCPIYVDRDAAPGGDGSSWERAFKTLADALAAGRAAVLNTSNSPTFWIAEGTYAGPTLDIQLTAVDGVKRGRFYGGFRGDESRLEDRDWKTHRTIIDGENARKPARNIDELNGMVITRGLGLEYVGALKKVIYTHNTGSIYDTTGVHVGDSELRDNERLGIYIVSGSGLSEVTIANSILHDVHVSMGYLGRPTLKGVIAHNSTFVSHGRNLVVDKSQFFGSTIEHDATISSHDGENRFTNSSFVNTDIRIAGSELPSVIRDCQTTGGTIDYRYNYDVLVIESSRLNNAALDLIGSARISGSRFIGTETRLSVLSGTIRALNSSFSYGNTPIVFDLDLAAFHCASCSFVSSGLGLPWKMGSFSGVSIVNSVAWPTPLTGADISYSCYSGATGATSRAVTASPFVVVPDADGFDTYFLNPQSACIDAGSDTAAAVAPAWQQQTTNQSGCRDKPALDPGMHYPTSSSSICL